MSITSFKSLTTMAAESCLLSPPSSLFHSKPLTSSLNSKHHHSHSLFPKLPPFPSLSLSLAARRHHVLTHVAQTSDWAQQEEDNTLTLEQEQEQEASLSDWEPSAEIAGEPEVEVSEPEEEDEEGEEEGGDFAEPPEEAKIFVGNLPYDVDSQKLAMLFEQAGTVEIAEVIYNRDTDQSRGFGFVTMSTVEEAETAVEKFHRYDLGGRLLTVNKASPRGERPERPPRAFEPAFRIYVGNLPWDVDNARLEQIFSEHGKVVNARVVYDRESGRSRGFGFVTMTDESEMNDAIAALDGQSLDGRAIRVNVAEDRPRRSF
ncbi:hypothetical protein PIB30_021118 [Stylosanthes scabra]|uniref:RRM domain-containing protein n=1 Tax=Stylosanthes scabra TaxID=79078 RepID=A0ABU6Z6C9_9FABA|nr:hypothetical protein [Stylosanthes scabra]